MAAFDFKSIRGKYAPTVTRLIIINSLLALVLAACGGTSSGATGSAPAQSAPAQAPAAAPTTAPATPPTTAPATAAPVANTAAPAAKSATAPSAVVPAVTWPLTIKDAAGEEFTFKEPPKLGVIWFGVIEAMADFNTPLYASSMTAADAKSKFWAPAGPPTHLIADSNNPELWAAAGVDLLITRVPPTPAQQALKNAAPIFYLHHPSYGQSSQTGYQAYIENLRILGQLTGKTQEAQAAIGRFDTLMKNLRALSTPETKALKVAVLFQGDAYTAIGPGNPFCVALAEVGLGQCVGQGDASTEINAEQFLTLNPDWIVYQSGAASYKDRKDPVWSQLKAVKEGKVYDARGNRYYCCSTRGLIHAMQEYISHVLPNVGIPDPGPHTDFEPLNSPLLKP